jgi:phytoene dehydrogenase-like protein
MPASPRARPSHAVVVGASLSGLAAAEALGRHVERVTLVERDDLPQSLVSLPGASGGKHHLRALRRILAAPRVVVRCGLEATGVLVEAGRVRGVEVQARSAVAGLPGLALRADLVVEASGRPAGAVVADGLLVIPPSDDPGAAAMVAVVLDRCLTEHLSRGADLAGLSATATQAIARAGSRSDGGPVHAATPAVEAC